jgi:hypothetical protein
MEDAVARGRAGDAGSIDQDGGGGGAKVGDVGLNRWASSEGLGGTRRVRRAVRGLSGGRGAWGRGGEGAPDSVGSK